MDLFDLDDHERAYVMTLATGLTLIPTLPQHEHITETQQMVLDNLDPLPAYMLGRCFDTLAWNRAACAVFGDYEQRSKEERNIASLLFLTPWVRTFIEDWEIHARRLVLHIRASHVQYGWDDPQFQSLIDELLTKSPEFTTWWQAHDVGADIEINKNFNHPEVGRLAFKQIGYDVMDAPGMRMAVYVPRNSETRIKLQELLRTT